MKIRTDEPRGLSRGRNIRRLVLICLFGFSSDGRKNDARRYTDVRAHFCFYSPFIFPLRSSRSSPARIFALRPPSAPRRSTSFSSTGRFVLVSFARRSLFRFPGYRARRTARESRTEAETSRKKRPSSGTRCWPLHLLSSAWLKNPEGSRGALWVSAAADGWTGREDGGESLFQIESLIVDWVIRGGSK